MTNSKTFVFRFADVEVRVREFCVVRKGEVLAVEPKAFRVLLYLLEHPQKLISKEELLDAVWGDASVTENSLTQNIAKLRRLLDDDAREPRYIATVATVGYRFVCDVEVAEEAFEGGERIGERNGHRKAGLGEASQNGVAGAMVAERSPQSEEALLPEAVAGAREGMVRAGVWRRPFAVAAVLVVGLGAAIWYLRRPLPPPHISAYTRVTRDGNAKYVAGTDGTRLYVNVSPWAFMNQVEANGRPFIYQVGMDGGEMVPLPLAIPGGAPAALGVSPDGSHLLVGAGEAGKSAPAIWNVQILGGAYRRLGSGWNATFSPDGNTVAFSSPEEDLWLVQSDGTGARKLAPGPAGKAAWSPDGRTIRFGRATRSDTDDENSLWEISSNGSNLHRLLPGFHPSGQLRRGNWTPDGKFFVFQSTVDLAPEGEQLWALDERRGWLRRPPADPIQLTSGPLSWRDPIPGKDGKTIFATGFTTSGELTRIDPATKAIAPFLGGISAFDVTFSKDGRFVAYISYPDGILWRANRDGSNPVQLTSPPSSPWFPRWSPDGSQILFAERSSGHSIAYVVPSDGGVPKRVLADVAGDQGGSDWSPDGRKILISRGWREPKEDVKVLEIASRTVTHVPGSVGAMFPLWSPNGLFIAAISYDQTAIKIFDIETKRWSAIPVKGQLGYIVISADSRSIYFELFDKTNLGNGRIFRISVKGGGMELVADLKGWRFARVPGDWMDLDPDGCLLLMRDTGSTDVYALTLEEK